MPTYGSQLGPGWFLLLRRRGITPAIIACVAAGEAFQPGMVKTDQFTPGGNQGETFNLESIKGYKA